MGNRGFRKHPYIFGIRCFFGENGKHVAVGKIAVGGEEHDLVTFSVGIRAVTGHAVVRAHPQSLIGSCKAGVSIFAGGQRYAYFGKVGFFGKCRKQLRGNTGIIFTQNIGGSRKHVFYGECLHRIFSFFLIRLLL